MPGIEINDILGAHSDVRQFIANNYNAIDTLRENPFEPLGVNYKCTNTNITISGFHPFAGFAYVIREGFGFYFLIPDNGKVVPTLEEIYGTPWAIGSVSIGQNNSALYTWMWKGYHIYFNKYNYTFSGLPKEGCYSIIISNLRMRDLLPKHK